MSRTEPGVSRHGADGANRKCSPLHSGTELAALSSQISTNLASIYSPIRATGYSGPLVALSYYSLSYSDPAQVQVSEFLNGVIAGVTNEFGGIAADGFRAFETPSASSGVTLAQPGY